MTSRRSQPLQLAVDPVAHAAEIARFEAAVVRGPAATDCWLFTKAIGGDGYGRWWIRRDGRRIMVRANRYALAVSLNGEVLPGWERALHGCDVPLCVRVSGPGELGLRHVLAGFSATTWSRWSRGPRRWAVGDPAR